MQMRWKRSIKKNNIFICFILKCKIPEKWNKTDLIIKDGLLEKYRGWSDRPNSFEELIIEDVFSQYTGS